MPQSQDKTHYRIKGDGAPVVLIHGLGLNLELWQWLEPALTRDHQVITYDLLGHGQSRAPQIPVTLDQFSDQLGALMAELNIENAALVGFSLGGMIARHMALTKPDLCRALVVLNSPHIRPPKMQDKVAARMKDAQKGGPASTINGAMDRWFSAGYLAAHPEIDDVVRKWVMANDPALYPSLYEVLVSGVPKCTGHIPNMPALVMTGADDFGNGPDMAAAISADIPGSETIILPKLRHMGLVEDPPGFNAHIVDFFDQLD